MNSERMRKNSSNLKKAQKRVNNLKGNLKKANEALDAEAEVEAHEASDELATKSLIKVDAFREKMDKALQDFYMRQVASFTMHISRTLARLSK